MIFKELRADLFRTPDWLWFKLNPKQAEKVKKVLYSKQKTISDCREYVHSPKVSLIVDSFNQDKNIPLLEERLRLTNAEELIVCDDGSIDGTTQEWIKRLTGRNDFFLRSNDLHEIRILDRAIHLARGEIICIIQDDDCPPKSGDWLDKSIALFDIYPDLAVLGGWEGYIGIDKQVWNDSVGRGNGPIPYIDPVTKFPFMFVDHVNIGPYFIRKSAYMKLGSFDTNYSAVGESGILFDSEYCYRAWMGGYKVGLVDIPCKSANLFGGTHTWGLEGRKKQIVENRTRLREKYGDQEKRITSLSEKSNRNLEYRN